MRFHYSKFWKYRTRFLITQEDFRNRRARGVCQESDTIVIVGSWKLYLSFVANFVASFVDTREVVIVVLIVSRQIGDHPCMYNDASPSAR